MAKPATKAPGAGIMCALYSLSRARRNGAQDSSLAETEISALKSFETGQPVSAFFTAVSNFALSAPGILATRSRWLLVMEKPWPTFSSEMVAGVWGLVPVGPGAPGWPGAAMGDDPRGAV